MLVAISPTTTEFQSINPERKKGEKLPFKISFMQEKKNGNVLTAYVHETNLLEVQIPFIQMFIAALWL